MDRFPSGVFYGTTHTYLGQEANAVGVLCHLREADIVFSNHRGHGHFLAYGGDPRALFAELMGKPSGVCGGRGGSQHLHWRDFYSNGVLGGTVPLATGIGAAEDELYTLNETGRAVWNRLDGATTLKEIADSLSAEYRCAPGEIERDLLGLVEELVKRGILVEVPGD